MLARYRIGNLGEAGRMADKVARGNLEQRQCTSAQDGGSSGTSWFCGWSPGVAQAIFVATLFVDGGSTTRCLCEITGNGTTGPAALEREI